MRPMVEVAAQGVRCLSRREVVVMVRTDAENNDAGAVDVPEADLVEQLTPAESDDEHEESPPPPTPLEVNPADAAEQRRSVPLDEDYPRG